MLAGWRISPGLVVALIPLRRGYRAPKASEGKGEYSREKSVTAAVPALSLTETERYATYSHRQPPSNASLLCMTVPSLMMLKPEP